MGDDIGDDLVGELVVDLRVVLEKEDPVGIVFVGDEKDCSLNVCFRGDLSRSTFIFTETFFSLKGLLEVGASPLEK